MIPYKRLRRASALFAALSALLLSGCAPSAASDSTLPTLTVGSDTYPPYVYMDNNGDITGLAEVPAAGDVFDVVEDERLAKTLVEQRKHEAKQAKFSEYQKVTLDNLFSQIAEGEMKELAIIVKADVQGSVEAVNHRTDV